MSNPESVSSRMASFGSSILSCNISFSFSPPEKPTFKCLDKNFSSIFNSFAFSFTIFKKLIASISLRPFAFLTEFSEVLKKLFVLTLVFL